MNTPTIAGQYISRSAKNNYLSFILQKNGLYTVKEYSYSQGYHSNVENGFIAQNCTIEMCISIAQNEAFQSDFNNLRNDLIHLKKRNKL